MEAEHMGGVSRRSKGPGKHLSLQRASQTKAASAAAGNVGTQGWEWGDGVPGREAGAWAKVIGWLR